MGIEKDGLVCEKANRLQNCLGNWSDWTCELCVWQLIAMSNGLFSSHFHCSFVFIVQSALVCLEAVRLLFFAQC